MILEYKIDYRSSSLLYEKIFLELLEEFDLDGNIERDHFDLRLYIESETPEPLESFATKLSLSLPHSIFLYGIEASIVESMPEQKYELPSHTKIPSPPCPKCLEKIKESYDIYQECSVCGYGAERREVDYRDIVQRVEDNESVKIDTLYGRYTIGRVSTLPKDSDRYNILAYDLATIERYSANIEEYELKALGAFERPIVRVKKSMKFTMDYENIESDLIYFGLADDGLLIVLMEELHSIGIDMIYISKEPNDRLEVVASSKEVLIVDGVRGVAKVDMVSKERNPSLRALYSIMHEHRLKDRYKNIASIYLSREYHNNILVYGERYGVVEYLSLNFQFNSISDIFRDMQSSTDSAKRLVDNYIAKFPEHYAKISSIEFDNRDFNIYKLWGLIAIILGFTTSQNPLDGAKEIDEASMSFLGDRGPRIDYKLIHNDNRATLDGLMVIKTAMSFHLAGVDRLGLAYGMVESFIEFLSNQLDEIRDSMSIEAVVISGSLLSNRRVFGDISKEFSLNNSIYFNNEIVEIR
jgi:hypothetical protein